MTAPKAIPSYRLHKPTGQGVVRLNGRDIYLGTHGTPESSARYERVIIEWLAAGRVVAEPAGSILTVAEVVARYWPYARDYYGARSAQAERVKRSLDHVLALYADLPIRDFGPLRLKAVLQRWVELGWVRRHINHCMGCVKRAIKWAVSEEIVPASVFESLRTVEGLRAGRTAARESAVVTPADETAVAATQAAAGPVVAAMIALQLATGMRPGEVVSMRPADVSRTGSVLLPDGRSVALGNSVWVYQPRSHKTAHHGHTRVILIGPLGQATLAPYLERSTEAMCFAPAEEVSQPAPGGRPGAYYRTDTYYGAIVRARKAADAAARAAAGGTDPERVFVPHWHPHQLRHNAATRLAAQFGLETTRILLGHRSVAVTQIYAETDLAAAAAAAAAAC